jgi:catechol 2,3-dioxygenase-like lactoylglutathione lyase family enzyme
MSPNVAVPTASTGEAARFYSEVLGFPRREGPGGVDEFGADPITFFITDDSELRGPVLELFVDDVEAARDALVAHGCQVVRWEGKGRDCYVRDPFGVTFNLWEEAEPGL